MKRWSASDGGSNDSRQVALSTSDHVLVAAVSNFRSLEIVMDRKFRHEISGEVIRMLS